MCATGVCRCCLLKGFSTQNHFTVLLESTECQRSLHFSAHHFVFGAFSCPVTFILTLLAPEVKCDDRKPLNKLKYQQWTFGFGVGSLNPKNKLPQVAHFAAFPRQSFFYFQWIFKQKYTQEDFFFKPQELLSSWSWTEVSTERLQYYTYGPQLTVSNRRASSSTWRYLRGLVGGIFL